MDGGIVLRVGGFGHRKTFGGTLWLAGLTRQQVLEVEQYLAGYDLQVIVIEQVLGSIGGFFVDMISSWCYA